MHWKRKWQPTPVFLPGEFHGQKRNLVGYSLWGCQESDTTERLSTTHIYCIIYVHDIYMCIYIYTYIYIYIYIKCKEIEENNRMGKTRDLFEKIRDTKGIFHAKIGSIKDRNGMEIGRAHV